MTMPIWRFWLKPEVDGGMFSQAVAGAIMPSIDKVGREFPLTVVSIDSGNELARPPSEGWYEKVETILLKTLEEGAEFTDFKLAVAGLEDPEPTTSEVGPKDSYILKSAQDTQTVVKSWFTCRAGDQRYSFECAGLPHPEEFRWLLLPEESPNADEEQKSVGESHGRFQSEDHRT